MKKKSAGILLYRNHNKELEIFLVHPGGPFWIKRDSGAWSIPKGEFEDDENPLEAAKREVEEETGIKIMGEFIQLTPVKLETGKIIYAWACQGNADPGLIRSNTFEIEWPPKSGKKAFFPEVDKAGWFRIREAMNKIIPAQIPLIVQIESMLRMRKLP